MAANIFTKSNYSFGVRAQFYAKWSHWITTIQSSSTVQSVPANAHKIEQTNATQKSLKSNKIDLENTIRTEGIDIIDLQVQCSKPIHINDILSSGPYGPAVLSYYKTNRKLNDHMRKLLVDAFLYYCTTMKYSVTKSACQSLSIQIKNTFEGEIAVR